MTDHYKVLRYFTDLQDNDYAYNVGDTFPREGMTVSQARLDELSGPHNKQKRPLIEPVVVVDRIVNDGFEQYMNPPVESAGNDKADKKYSKHDIMRMPKADLQKLGEEIGIPDASQMTGNALKPKIIKKLGL